MNTDVKAMAGGRKILRAAAYVRKSTEDGLDQEYNSLDCQRDAIESYVRSQMANGWTLIDKLYSDPGYSGGNLDRPGVQELIKDVKAGLIDIVVVYKLDRLSRSIMNFAELSRIFDAHNVAFVSVTQQIDTSNAAGRMLLNILISFAQFEREMSIDRIRDKVRACKERGMWVGGPVPFGYRVERKKLVIDPATAPTVVRIFDLYARHGEPMRVARELAKAGVAPIAGQPWSAKAVRRIVSNPRYVGDAKFGDKIVKGEQEPIVARDVWVKVQGLRVQHGSGRERRECRAEPALLANLVHCGHCGSKLCYRWTGKRREDSGQKRYGYYICSKSLYHGDECRIKRIPASVLESTVEGKVCEVLSASLAMTGMAARRSGLAQDRILHALAQAGAGRRLAESFSPSEFRTLFAAVIVRIDITEAGLNIRARTPEGGSGESLSAVGRIMEDGTLLVTVPLQIRTVGGEKRLVRVAADGTPSSAQCEDDPLLRAVARAFTWTRWLETGERRSVAEIAADKGVDPSYINHIIRLVALSPRILRAIIAGLTPVGLSLEKIRKMDTDDWREQERLLGFEFA